jgi:hypothetical protein
MGSLGHIPINMITLLNNMCDPPVSSFIKIEKGFMITRTRAHISNNLSRTSHPRMQSETHELFLAEIHCYLHLPTTLRASTEQNPPNAPT